MLELPVREFLALEAMRSARVVAGRAGLDRPVRMINMLDHPGAIDWLRGHELLITTGAWFAKEPELIANFIEQCVPAGVAGLILAVGKEGYFQKAPAELRVAGDRVELPIIEFDWNVYAVDILQQGLERIIHHQVQHLKWAASVHRKLASVILEEGGGVPELATRLAELVRNEVVVEDVEHQLICAGFPAGSTVARHAPAPGQEEPWPYTTRGRKRGPRADGTHQVSCPIDSGGMRYGFVCIRDSKRPLDELDVVAAETAALLMALTFAKDEKVRETERRLQATLFDDLIALRPGDDMGSVAARAALASYPLLGPQVGLVADVADYALRLSGQGFDDVVVENQKLALLSKLSHTLYDAGIPNVWCTRRDRGLFLTALVGDRTPSQIAAELRRMFDRRLIASERNAVSIGIGAAFTDMVDARRSLEEADQALGAGRRISGASTATAFDDLGYHRILLSRLDSPDLDSFVTQQLGALRDYDERNHTNLVATLRAFLEAHGQQKATSRALRVHPNTLPHRLSRIREVSGIDVHNADDRFNAWLALKAVELKPELGRQLLAATGLNS